MDKLLKRKKVLKSKITRIIKAVNNLDESSITLSEIEHFLQDAEKLKVTLDSFSDGLLEACTEDKYCEYESELHDILNSLDIVIIKLRTLKPSVSIPIQNVEKSNVSSCSHEKSTVHLPKIELPTFSGNLLEWISFRDLFNASVDSKENLSPAQKLQYLKLSLSGEAAGLLQSVHISDSNYAKALKILKDRFENEEEMIHAALEKLFTQPSIASESAAELRRILDITNQCIGALENLRQPVQHWDSVLIYVLKRKLDPETLKQWMLTHSNRPANFDEFKLFIDQRARALSSLCSSPGNACVKPAASKPKPLRVGGFSKEAKGCAATHHVASAVCVFCKANHSIYKCSKFQNLTLSEKYDAVYQNKLCSNCLRQGHFKSSCVSPGCKVCREKHHSMLHRWEVKSNQAAEKENSLVSNHTTELTIRKQILLPTSNVVVVDRGGAFHVCRALVDSGSQSSFITENCVQTLGLKRRPSKLQVTGISPDKPTTTNGIVNVDLRSSFNQDCCVNVNLHILSRITCNLPQSHVDTTKLDCFNLLKLADPHYSKPGDIDMLLGADVCADIFLTGHLKAPASNVVAQETKLGWIIFGSVTSKQDSDRPIMVSHLSITNVDDSLRRFWELEEVPTVCSFTPDEAKCVAHFENSHLRDESGRYVVRLPIKEDSEPLGASRDIAVIRLQQMERKFARQPDLRDHYTHFMNEYVQLGHMELVPPGEIAAPVESSCYIPHHSVTKTENLEGKFRVVFNASSKTTTGVSLNDKLLVGPTIQDNIFQIVLRFREHPVVMTADVQKMYRQVKVAKPDANLQRILWRPSSAEPIQDYRLCTVTYGTASAPFLATKCLHQVAIDDGEKYPLAAKVTLRDFYVDDLLTGAETVEDAVLLQSQLIKLLQGGGFDLRKWSSNRPEIVASVPEELRAVNLPQDISCDEAIKTLGVLWHPEQDSFAFKTNMSLEVSPPTKRSILSNISKIFDPLGWITPVVITGKILLQQIWKEKVSWDGELPPAIVKSWCDFVESLSALQNLRVPRFVSTDNAVGVELLGFCDASEKAFAASVYIKTTTSDDGSVTVHLMAAKSRVAPLKSTSLPRLELCGALLLAKLICAVIKASTLSFNKVRCWSDSTIVLSWLKSPSCRWKTFVANRVAQIHELLPEVSWNHIPSEYNPADCASRGMPTKVLALHDLWWHGPSHHILEATSPELGPVEELNEALKEERKQKDIGCEDDSTRMLPESALTNQGNCLAIVTVSNAILDLVQKFSSLSKLKRVVAYILRFSHNCKNPQEKQEGFLSSNELHRAMTAIIRCVQSTAFSDEISCLKKGQVIPRASKLLSLHPFLDCSGVLRVGGRLRHADAREDVKHPILLPSKHHLTELVIWEHHNSNLHAGPQLTQASLQQQFWIVASRKEIRRVLRKCITCIRQAAPTTKQMMGDLPSPRIRPSRPFLHAGMDYAGPFTIRMSKSSKGKTCKAYLALFICFSTKAIHCELVSDLSTPAVLAALKRFISRRGKPSDLYSDCGTNFKGAHREIKELYALCQSSAHNEAVARQLAKDNITWHFNPPASPHMGGLWEAGIKSVKYHLKRIVSRHVVLTFEELYTLVCQVEASLNSRPLCPMSSDPNDLSALTPGHFLIGEPLNAIPERDYTPLKINRLTRWQLIERLFQHFWGRWRAEYLSHLQSRQKWHRICPNLKKGDLVIVKDDRLPPMQWRLGRVVEVYEGPDGICRVADVQTSEGVIKRNIQRLCILPIESEDN